MRRAVALAALALLGDAAASQSLSGRSVTYLCEGGAVLRVAYVNVAEGESFAVVDWAGRLIPMRLVPAASGARYAALDARDGYRWHTKGEEGFLTRLAAGRMDAEEIVLRECRALT
jgi:membrane-bound inhibitor of C-type lysozyme